MRQDLDASFDATDHLTRYGSVNSSNQGNCIGLDQSRTQIDIASSMTAKVNGRNDDEMMKFDDGNEMNAYDEIAKNWPGIDFDHSDSDYIHDPYLNTNATPVPIVRNNNTDGIEGRFDLLQPLKKIGDWAGMEEASSHLCYVAGLGECVLCAKPPTPLQGGFVQPAVLDDTNHIVGECEEGCYQVPDQGIMAPYFEPPGPRNRALIKEAQENAYLATLLSHHWFLPGGFRPGSDPEATLSAGVTSADFDNDPEIGAGFGAISRDRLPKYYGADSFSFLYQKVSIDDNVLVDTTSSRETSPVGSLFDAESEEDDPCTVEQPRNDAHYTSEERSAIQEQLRTRLPHLNDHAKCANCGKGPRPKSVIVCALCNKARYCGKYCQVWDWPIHLFVCGRLPDADAEAVKDLVVWTAAYWREAVVEICKAMASGTRFEDCPKVKVPREEDVRMKGNGQKRKTRKRSASSASMIWSRALSLHLAKGRRFTMDLFEEWKF